MCYLTVARSGYKAQRTQPSRGAPGGAPRYDITRQQLQFLVQCGFQIKRMKQLLGVSQKTVKRRLRYTCHFVLVQCVL